MGFNHNVNFQDFVLGLKAALHEPLPGKKAQALMAPMPIDDRRFKENPINPAKLGGVMILLYPENDEIRLPLMKRPIYDGAHSGQISLPGGKYEKQDANLTTTALRETEEEIGVDKSKIQVLGQLSEMFIIASNFKVIPTVGIVEGTPEFILDTKEVERIYTPGLSDLLDTEKRKVKTMHFPSHTIHSPYFDIQGEVVWGATAMILGELLEVIKRIY